MGTVIPFSYLEKAQRLSLWQQAIRKAVERAIDKNVGGMKGKTVDEVIKGRLLNIRQPFTGVTGAAIEDFAVLTGARAAQESWGQDAADLTVDVFSSILAASEKLNDKQVCVFFGFIDLTDVPMLSAIRFKRGTDTLDVWEVEHCYGDPQEANGGISQTQIVYDPEDPMTIEMNFRSGSFDQHVVPLGVVVEPWGENVTRPT